MKPSTDFILHCGLCVGFFLLGSVSTKDSIKLKYEEKLEGVFLQGVEYGKRVQANEMKRNLPDLAKCLLEKK